jgi:hypothetical protein
MQPWQFSILAMGIIVIILFMATYFAIKDPGHGKNLVH